MAESVEDNFESFVAAVMLKRALIKLPDKNGWPRPLLDELLSLTIREYLLSHKNDMDRMLQGTDSSS